MSYGAVTGASNRWAAVAMTEDAAGRTDVSRIFFNTRCWALYEVVGTKAIISEGDFDSFITDGIRLNQSTASGNTEDITVILFGGDDVSAHANAFIPSGTDVELDITDPGFEPDILFLGHAQVAAADGLSDGFDFGIGIVHNDGASTITQRSWRGNLSDNDTAALCTENASQLGGTVGTGSAYIDFDTFDSSGFSATLTGTGGVTGEVGYLALKFANHSSLVDTWGPSGTGNQSYTGGGFKPQFVMGIFKRTPFNFPNTTTGLSIGYGVTDGVVDSSHWFWQEDAAADSNTDADSSAKAADVKNNVGTDSGVAAFSSFDSGGWTYNFSDSADGNWMMLAVEEDAAPPSRWSVAYNRRRLLRRIAYGK